MLKIDTYKLIQDDCLKFLPKLEENSVDSIITDPPYGLKFMGKNWDHGIPGIPFWKEILRVAKPGAHMLTFGGTRTYHRLTCAIEDAGWEIRDCLMWVYGCLSEDTEILTKDGWKHYHKDILNDSVLCYDKGIDSFEFNKPTNKFLYENKYPAYRIKSDKTDQIVSRNHRVLIEQDGRKVFERAEQLARKSEATIPVLESLSDLPETIYDRDKGTSCEKRDLLQRVQKQANSQKEERTSHSECNGKARGKEWKKHAHKGRENWTEKSEKELKERMTGETNPACNGASIAGSKAIGQTTYERGERSSYQSRRRGQQDREPNVVQDKSRPQKIRGGQGCGTTLATIKPIKYNGKVWCVEVPTGAFVVRRNGKIFITGNSGFPKSHNISKAIDKSKRGVPHGGSDPTSANHGKYKTQKTEGKRSEADAGKGFGAGPGQFMKEQGTKQDIELCEEAKEWDGWGTTLKPAWEPIILARKPFKGTVANNILKYGTGGLNIDECRVEVEGNCPARSTEKSKTELTGTGGASTYGKFKVRGSIAIGETTQGRFPANLIHDGSDEVVELFPNSKGQGDVKGTEPSKTGDENTNCYGQYERVVAIPRRKDSGSAARFFYCSKASKKDRGEGNKHPTVKPTDLLKYLCKLITQPNGLILDPFMGSGSTGKAALLEGFRFIGIEKEEEYIDIAKQRIENCITK